MDDLGQCVYTDSLMYKGIPWTLVDVGFTRA
jgi:hypothetical protein